jgi:hypothetical protein
MAVRQIGASSDTGKWFNLPPSTKTNDYTVLATDAGFVVIANKATAIGFTLPAASAGSGIYLFRNIGVGLLTISRAGTDTIEGGTSLTVATGEDVLLYSDGASVWRAINLGSLPIAGGKNMRGGVTATPYSLGNIASFTADGLKGQLQYGTNHGAFTLTAPTADTEIDILVVNDGSAGAITFSGFTVGSLTGDPLTTTNGHKFIISIKRINGTSTYTIKALQ